ncbi:MAG: DUF1573 domain-containing protein [Phycisphaerae bacterium]|nr:DUF1573 domain-containing protein [Phycisphaerae bacterium]
MSHTLKIRSWGPAAVLSAAFAAASTAQLPPPPKPTAESGGPAPRIFVQNRVIDLGTILEGDRVPLEWTIENRGEAELVIHRAVAGCGCTVLESPEEKRSVPPGGSYELKAQFDTTNRIGNQDKSIVIYSSDPLEPELKLEFLAEVERLYDRSPQTALNMKVLQRGDTAVQTLDVIPVEGRSKATVTDIIFEGGQELATKIEPFSVGDRTGSRVYFSVPPDAPLGILTSKALIKLEVDGIPRETWLVIRGQVTGDLTWIPKVIDATRQPVVHGTRLAPLSIRSPNDTPFRILSAEAGPMLNVTVRDNKPLKPGIDFDVVPQVREDAPDGPFGAMLTVRTTSLDQPVVQVPVFGIVAPRLMIDPPLILLRADGTPKGTVRRVKLQAPPTETLEVKKLTAGLRAVQVAVDEESSRNYRHIRYLSVRYAGGLSPGIHESQVEVTTNIPGLELVRIPVVIDVPE